MPAPLGIKLAARSQSLPGITLAGDGTLLEARKDTSEIVAWKSDGGMALVCQSAAALTMLAVIVQFVMGVLNTISRGGPDWFCIGLTLVAAVVLHVLARELTVKKITMRKGKISFSLCFLLELFGRLQRRWTDIGAIALQDESEEHLPQDDEERRQLVMHFASGGAIKIPLRELTVADLESLFRASKRWGSTAVMAPELIELRRKLVAGPSPSMNLSLTTLWEKELQSHFTTSTFVPLAAGTTLGQTRLRVISQIAVGGLSAIYLARASDGRKVILKELVLHKANETGMVRKAKELFQRESGLLVKLHHPQIARVYDHFVENSRDYLVLEYIPGQTLRQLVEAEGPRLEDKVLEWAQATAGILLYLHAQTPPILHRDLTPENLVLGEDNLIHLIDFGAANEFVAGATGTLIGKQAYMAPEQFRGKPTPASDIYSLGATMFYLLTARDPEALSSSNPAAVNSSVSVQTGEFVAMLTDCDPAKRPTDCLEVIQRLTDLRATERGAVISLGKK